MVKPPVRKRCVLHGAAKALGSHTGHPPDEQR